MIVIFNGPPGSGKDEGTAYFAKNFGYEHLSFKYQLFKETFKLFEVSKDWFMEGYNDRAIKEQPSALLGGLSRREAMIYTSEKYIKPKFGKSFFGDKVAEEIVPGQNYAISDGGFVEELEPIINKVGYDNMVLIQLVRDGCSYSSDSRRYFNGEPIFEIGSGVQTPINEEHILPEKLPIRTYRIWNNGSIRAFHAILETIKTEIEGELV